MPINAHPDYLAAEKEYLLAQTPEGKIEKLKKMISVAPSHKGAENLRAQLKTRLKKLTSQLEKSKKSGKSKTKGIKKEGHQVVIIGFAGTGKSWLLSRLTNATPKIKQNPYEEFTTKKPAIGILNHEGVQIQLIENPAIDSDYYDKGLTNSADAILILVTNYEQIEKILNLIQNKKIIICYNEISDKSPGQKRKIKAKLQSKKYNFVIINHPQAGGWNPSIENPEDFENLKNKIFSTFDKIRVYTKEPGKEKAKKPMILNPNSTIKEAAEKILKGFSKNIRETKIWGPSSKFPGQVVGLSHRLKDLDVVEFKTR